MTTKPNRRKLTSLHVQRAAPRAKSYLIWDTTQTGLVLRVEPTGTRSYKVIYRFHGRMRWLHLARANAISLEAARLLAQEHMLTVARGRDPAAEKQAERGRGTFKQLAEMYVEQHAKKKNKSWRQAERLVQRILPSLGGLQAHLVTRADVRTAINKIDAPITANQTLAAVSAIFTWAMREDLLTANPSSKIDRNATTKRERILSDAELPLFWSHFDLCEPLKVLLLVGQRPGEVAAMRWQDIQDGWWTLPGKPDGDWPGTKNGESHRVWLPAAVQEIIGEQKTARTAFVFDESTKAMATAMRAICSLLQVENKITPHDLRRTHGSTITRLGFGRDAMNRIQNHREGGIASVYDRYQYEQENKRIMEAVAAQLLRIATGAAADNVVQIR